MKKMRHRNKRPKERNKNDRQKNWLCAQVQMLEKELQMVQEQNRTVKNGTILSYNSQKGYGFIRQDSGKENLYFHATRCKEEPRTQMRVQYEIVEGRKGLEAINVMIVR